MPAIRTYKVTRTQSVTVHTAHGYLAAQVAAERAFDGCPPTDSNSVSNVSTTSVNTTMED